MFARKLADFKRKILRDNPNGVTITSEKESFMKPPLTGKQITKIHEHQFFAIHCDPEFLVPYLCPEDKSPLIARIEGLLCLKCGWENTGYIVYPGKMNVTGKIPEKVFD